MNHPYADFVASVEKPARYLGGEFQSVLKDWDSAACRMVMAFPDIYDIGMSHLGTKILYSLLNKDPRILCERSFTPWIDMEAELRRRALPLLSLESARPLRDFDIVGLSLQYELTYTNCLTLLDLGGIPLRAADRGDDDPLVIGGGPTATHPEPIALFFDCFLIGEAEEVLPRLCLAFAGWKRAGVPRRERLLRLAELGYVYVPELYGTRIDPLTHLQVVAEPLDPRVPARVRRTWVEDLNKFPFPSDTPVPYAEAIFDRASVEIARGCTEGCRFCQAGMIYRPIRERDPESIVDTIVKSIKGGGYDETSLTCLSTADYSCIVPLVKKVMGRLREEKVSLSVSSLRAYGLQPELLDELASVRATGLTFAPEAGTQRMRDVINKNITEEDISRSAENIFSRGWSRMKLYFMIGLPTETDEDVAGIVQTGGRLRRLGKRHRQDADVTVSVSSHVPKPHTPFQWCAMDTMEDLRRKQRLLRELAQREHVTLKWHTSSMSWVEGIFSRGDRRLADVVELAWRKGARFDGWEDQFELQVWIDALEEAKVDPMPYLMTIPIDGGLPWDHIDIGLEDGFLLAEYRKALKDRASPPCGKPFGSLLHHTNVEAALDEKRRLVCYDCGVACDLSQMRGERLSYLRRLGAEHRPGGVIDKMAEAPSVAAGQGAQEPVPAEPERARPKWVPNAKPRVAFTQTRGFRYRLRFTKLGRASFISHLDTMRLLQRMLRRAQVEMIYSLGFHPKPEMSFGPALALGVASLGEVCDLRLESREGAALPAEELKLRLQAAAPEGVIIEDLIALDESDATVTRCISTAELAIGVPLRADEGAEPRVAVHDLSMVATFRDRPLQVVRARKGEKQVIDVARYLVEAQVAPAETAARLKALLLWPETCAVLIAGVRVMGDGGAKPGEVAEALLGQAPPFGTRYARLALRAEEGIDLCDLARLRAALPARGKRTEAPAESPKDALAETPDI